MTLSYDDVGAAWRAARPPQVGHHLDSAACGRQSNRVLDAVAGHARREAEVGGYVAEAAATAVLDEGRAALGALLGFAGEDIAFVENAQAALMTLLAALPLEPGDVAACAPGEYGPNLAAFDARGLRVAELPTDGERRIDVAAFARSLRRPGPRPDLVHVTQVGSHSGLLQPAAQMAQVCREQGVVCVVDAAQSLGHVDAVTVAAAAYGTSRKWLAGPRGVGLLAVRPALAGRLRPALGPDRWPEDLPAARWVESREGHIAGRVGLSLAVAEHQALGPERVRARLAAIGSRTRALLAGAGGWRVLESRDEPTSMTTLAPPTGADVRAVHRRLLALGVVTTYAGPERAPREMRTPRLRVSPHLDVTDEDLAAMRDALERLGDGLRQTSTFSRR